MDDPAPTPAFRARGLTKSYGSGDAVAVAALFRRGIAWAAFVLEGGMARERPVGISQFSERMAVATSGLGPGEAVVLFPASALRDGMGVRSAP